AARHRHRRRADREPDPHALHDARRLPVRRPHERVGAAPPAVLHAGARMRRIVLGFCALLSACAVGPDYKRPEANAPVEFKELPGWRMARPQDEAPKGPWWRVFNDPELEALMQRGEVSNQTIRAAEARPRQAKALYDQARASFFPSVNGNGTATRGKSPSLSTQPNFATGAVNNFNVNASASWEIDL